MSPRRAQASAKTRIAVKTYKANLHLEMRLEIYAIIKSGRSTDQSSHSGFES
jgi:hypothetical protein